MGLKKALLSLSLAAMGSGAALGQEPKTEQSAVSSVSMTQTTQSQDKNIQQIEKLAESTGRPFVISENGDVYVQERLIPWSEEKKKIASEQLSSYVQETGSDYQKDTEKLKQAYIDSQSTSNPQSKEELLKRQNLKQEINHQEDLRTSRLLNMIYTTPELSRNMRKLSSEEIELVKEWDNEDWQKNPTRCVDDKFDFGIRKYRESKFELPAVYEPEKRRAYDDAFDMAHLQAHLNKKSSFEFDGMTYDTKTAFEENKLYKEVRRSGKNSYIWNGKEKEAVSELDDAEQLKMFGNIYSDGQDKKTTENLEKVADSICNQFRSLNSTMRPGFRSRIFEVWKASGSPDVHYQQDDMTLISSIIEKASGRYVPHYEPSFIGGAGTVMLSKGSNTLSKDFFEEMSHAFRDYNNCVGEMGQYIGDGLKDLTTLNGTGFGVKSQLKNYTNQNRMEYDTHTIVEPNLRGYIMGLIPSLPETYAMIDLMRQKNGNSYAWTSEAQKRVDRGKEILEMKDKLSNKKTKGLSEIELISAQKKFDRM